MAGMAACAQRDERLHRCFGLEEVNMAQHGHELLPVVSCLQLVKV